jgi:hypothetical protein
MERRITDHGIGAFPLCSEGVADPDPGEVAERQR